MQCLDDFGIPLKLSHTVVDIKGKERVEGITLAEVDENRRPIPGTEEFFECDTLLLSVGLIRRMSFRTGRCEAEQCDFRTGGKRKSGDKCRRYFCLRKCSSCSRSGGFCFGGSRQCRKKCGSLYKQQWKDKIPEEMKITLSPQNGVRYTVPSEIRIGHMAEEQLVRFRVGNVYKNCYIRAYLDGERIFSEKTGGSTGEMEQIKLKRAASFHSGRKTETG